MKHIPQIVDQQMREWEMRRMGDHKAPPSEKGPVICISRELGVGARVIARRLSEELDCIILGRDTIDSVAEDLHAQRRLVDALDEQGRASLERWVEGYLHGSPVEYDEYARSLIKVFRAAAEKGSVIFLGRGANYVLGLEQAFCVRLVAPLERRITQLTTYESFSREQAQERIRQKDLEQAAFIRKVFHRDIHDPLAFHLTLNLFKMDLEHAVQVILMAMAMEGFLPHKSSKAKTLEAVPK
jgi:hypothetical protein